MAPICTTAANTAQIAGYAYVLPPGDNHTADGEYLETTDEGHLVMVNGTLIRIMLKKPFRDSELNELLYVIIVIVFYATALMTLIITQIKRQRREGSDVDYYDEYLQRNQEVKRTCQTATNLVRKSDRTASPSIQRSAASPSIARSAASPSFPRSGGYTTVPGDRGGGASANLLEPPSRARDQSPRSVHRHSLGLSRGGVGSGAGGGGVGGGGGGNGGEEVGIHTPSVTPRELSPMLESIPDIGT